MRYRVVSHLKGFWEVSSVCCRLLPAIWILNDFKVMAGQVSNAVSMHCAVRVSNDWLPAF
jgi:hypothetical protein